MKLRPVAVAETDTFVRQSDRIWKEDDRTAFVDFIARNPEAGDLIPETGGVRKIRWKRAGVGKRGGVRVIYFYYQTETPIYLLMVYAKDRKEDLSAEERKAARAFTTALKRSALLARRRAT
jgi:hypothetical protein